MTARGRVHRLGHIFGPLIGFGVMLAPLALAQPRPGDVFREYRYTHDTIIEADVTSKKEAEKLIRRQKLSQRERSLDIWDLEDAVRAEVALELWGGHAGTSGHSLRINGSPWLAVPQIKGAPTEPACYQRLQLGSAVVPLPIETFRQGRNVFQFRSGGQVCHDFGWGIYKVYAFTVRVYYDPDKKPRRQGRILTPTEGARIGDRPSLTAEARGTEGRDDKTEFTQSSILRVDYVGLYDDVNWEGDGVYRQWHYQLEQGQIKNHIGTATAPPWKVVWDTRWVPDQDQPLQIAARLTDTHGVITMTPALTVTLARKGRSVKLYKASQVPEKFGVRAGRRATCAIQVDDDPRKARAARLVLSTWAGAHADGIGLNDQKIVERVGTADHYSFDALDFPAKLLKKGTNTFFVFSNTKHHAAEIHWPGPMLLLEFGRSLPPPR